MIEELKVNWIVHSDSATDNYLAGAVCEHGDHIYVIGQVEEKRRMKEVIDLTEMGYRIEKRRKIDGRLVNAETSKLGELYDSLVVNDKLYVVGGRELTLRDKEWIIFVLDLDLNVLKRVEHNPSARIDEAFAIDSDGDYIYIAGADSLPGNDQWRVEKRRIDDLELVKHYTSNPSEEWNVAWGIGINPKTKHVWVLGHDSVEGHSMWRIEILDENLGLVKAIRPCIGGSAYAIAFDEEGNAYVVSWKAVVKFDKDGREVARCEGGSHDKVLYSEGLVYTVGTEQIGDYDRHVLYAFNKDLKLVDKLVLSEGISEDAWFRHGRMAFDGKNLYVAGYDGPPGDYRWTIYSINIPIFRATRDIEERI